MINTKPNHKHTYDAKGNMTCCSLYEKIDAITGKPHAHSENDGHGHEHAHEAENSSLLKTYLSAIISFIFLMLGLVFDYLIKPSFFNGYIRLIWYIIAYIPVGIPVMKETVKSISKGAFFSEFFLMSIATLGAFFIKEYL